MHSNLLEMHDSYTGLLNLLVGLNYETIINDLYIDIPSSPSTIHLMPLPLSSGKFCQHHCSFIGTSYSGSLTFPTLVTVVLPA
jgi:hypothetical protein